MDPDMFDGDSYPLEENLPPTAQLVSTKSDGHILGAGPAPPRKRVVGDEDEEDPKDDANGPSSAGLSALNAPGVLTEGRTFSENAGALPFPPEGAKRSGPVSRPAALAFRLAKEGTRRKREQEERAMDVLPDMQSEDWRQAGSGPREAGGDGGHASQGEDTARHPSRMKRRKLYKGKTGASEESVAFGLENLVLATGSAQAQVPRLSKRTREAHLLPRPPPGQRALRVVTGRGGLVYVRCQGRGEGSRAGVGEGEEAGEAALPLASRLAKLQSDLAGGGGKGGLLTLPMAELLARVERRRYRRLRTSQALGAKEAAAGEEDGPVGGERVGEGAVQAIRAEPASEQLWVSRYSPSAFAHLLSEEATNREVLRLLRQWDAFVFKRAVPKRLAEVSGPGDRRKMWGGQGGGSSQAGHDGTGQEGPGRRTGKSDPDFGDTDLSFQRRDRRPEPSARAILLAGPPGIGKTTLAHVIAEHCGYRPLEINASDDRSAGALREKMTRAMQNQAVLGDKRPNCIILDEADGIEGKAAMKMIVNIIKAPLKSKQKGSAGSKDEAGGHSGADGSVSCPPLTRPLICICNDLYVPALRALREVATVFRFRRRTNPRLLQRLKTICQAENLPVEGVALSVLCEASGHDVRSCLNTLQFFQARLPAAVLSQGQGQEEQDKPPAAFASHLSRQLLEYVGEGLKDQEKDMLQVCQSLFRKPASKATATPALLPGEEGAGTEERAQSRVRDTDRVMTSVASYSDHAHVLLAAQENYCQLRFTDPNLTKVLHAAEWLAFSDLVHGRQMEGLHVMEDLHLATAAALHLLCRVETRPRLALPRKDHEYRSARLSRQHILQSFGEGCSLQALWARRPTPVVLDVVSPLMHILNPNLRPVNPDLYSFAEKAGLRHLVDVLLACGISYVQSPGSGLSHPHQHSGAPERLEMLPALVHLAEFGLANDGTGAPKSETLPVQRPRPPRLLPAFVKLLATQEAKLEALRRTELRKTDALKAKKGMSSSTGQGPRSNGLPSKAAASCEATPGPNIAPLVAKEEEEPGPKAWYVKLGTKRSTTKTKSRTQTDGSPVGDTGTRGLDLGEGLFPPEHKQSAAKKSTVRFKYVAGYTNAVRRPVYMKDMI